MNIQNSKIIKRINTIAGFGDNTIGSLELGKQITFHLNTFVMRCDSGQPVFLSHIKMSYFRYFYTTVGIWVKRIMNTTRLLLEELR